MKNLARLTRFTDIEEVTNGCLYISVVIYATIYVYTTIYMSLYMYICMYICHYICTCECHSRHTTVPCDTQYIHVRFKFSMVYICSKKISIEENIDCFQYH